MVILGAVWLETGKKMTFKCTHNEVFEGVLHGYKIFCQTVLVVLHKRFLYLWLCLRCHSNLIKPSDYYIVMSI